MERLLDGGEAAPAARRERSLIGQLGRSIFLYRSVGLLISGVVVVAGTLAVAGASRSLPGEALSVGGAAPSSAYLFKRTFASADAASDGAFVEANLGLALASNVTYATAGGTRCATRNALTALGDWELHYFESRVTPEGARTVGDWSAFLARLHGDVSRRAWLPEWDAFAGNVVTFFAPSLSPFLERFEDNGVSALKVKFADGSGSPYFAAFVASPASGHLLCVAGAEVDDSSAFLEAADAPDAVCAGALGLRDNVTALAATWAALGGTRRNGRGLPDLLAVGTSLPTTSLDASAAFLADVAAMAGGETSSRVERLGAACDAQTLALPFRSKASALASADELTYDVSLTFVANRAAFPADRSLEQLEAEVQATHRVWVRQNGGWDRWLDAHVGVQVPLTSLDAVAAALARRRRPYKAHLDDAAKYEGSLWSSGAAASSVGVEFHGTFDLSYFADANLTTLDYCAADSDGDAAVSQTGRAGR